MNCKPGDLAIVIKDEYPQNIGKIGRVICYDNHHSTGLEAWCMEFPSALLCLNGRYSDYVGVADYCLRPVSGLPMEEETTEKLKEPA
jgi:hypothetical protein